MEETRQLPFFVYGTLLPEQPNHFLWESAIVTMEPAIFLGGRLYDMGYYPMLITAVPSEIVQGMAITVKPALYKAVTQRLDELEGYNPEQPDESEYQRQAVDIILEDGRCQQAWIYVGHAAYVQDRPVIAGGSWANHVANKQPGLQKWWNSIRTVAGLHKNRSNG